MTDGVEVGVVFADGAGVAVFPVGRFAAQVELHRRRPPLGDDHPQLRRLQPVLRRVVYVIGVDAVDVGGAQPRQQRCPFAADGQRRLARHHPLHPVVAPLIDGGLIAGADFHHGDAVGVFYLEEPAPGRFQRQPVDHPGPHRRHGEQRIGTHQPHILVGAVGGGPPHMELETAAGPVRHLHHRFRRLQPVGRPVADVRRQRAVDAGAAEQQRNAAPAPEPHRNIRPILRRVALDVPGDGAGLAAEFHPLAAGFHRRIHQRSLVDAVEPGFLRRRFFAPQKGKVGKAEHQKGAAEQGQHQHQQYGKSQVHCRFIAAG